MSMAKAQAIAKLALKLSRRVYGPKLAAFAITTYRKTFNRRHQNEQRTTKTVEQRN